VCSYYYIRFGGEIGLAEKFKHHCIKLPLPALAHRPIAAVSGAEGLVHVEFKRVLYDLLDPFSNG
jgi:hypothetical protein